MTVDDSLLVVDKVKVGLLEALLGELCFEGAQAIGVPTTVWHLREDGTHHQDWEDTQARAQRVLGERRVELTVVEHLPGDLSCPANFPLHSRVHRWERRAVGAVVRVLSRRIVASLSAFLEERGATCEAAGIHGGGGARRSPRIVLVDIVDRTRRCVAVDGAKHRIIDRGLLAEATHVDLAAARDMVALWAADEAALLVVETCLAIVAVLGRAARDVRAVFVRSPVLRGVHADEVCGRARRKGVARRHKCGNMCVLHRTTGIRGAVRRQKDRHPGRGSRLTVNGVAGAWRDEGTVGRDRRDKGQAARDSGEHTAERRRRSGRSRT